jgi:plastocyanin
MLFAVAAAVGLAIPAGAAQTHRIAMDGTRFVPEMLIVERGDRVIWINKDPFPHTATAGRTFDSRSVGPGQSWSYVPRKSGEFAYICTLHPGMKGVLRVR